MLQNQIKHQHLGNPTMWSCRRLQAFFLKNKRIRMGKEKGITNPTSEFTIAM